jgi:hypothetical protein
MIDCFNDSSYSGPGLGSGLIQGVSDSVDTFKDIFLLCSLVACLVFFSHRILIRWESHDFTAHDTKYSRTL